MLHFIGASIVWWLGVCAPLLLAMSRFSSGEYLDSAVSCALALALTPVFPRRISYPFTGKDDQN